MCLFYKLAKDTFLIGEEKVPLFLSSVKSSTSLLYMISTGGGDPVPGSSREKVPLVP